MKSKKRTIGILIVVIVILFGFACSLLIYRNKLSSESSDITNYSSVSPQRYFDDFYNKPITDEKIALEAIEANRYKLGYNDKDLSFEFKSKSEFLGTSYRFNILYKGIPLDSDEVNVLVDEDDKAKHLLSRELPLKQLQKINTTPKITQDEAIKIAKSTMNMKSDMKLKLVLYEVNDTYVLAYYYCGTTICIINAENGEVVACYSAIDYSTGEFTGQNGDIHQVFYDDYEYENNYIKNALWDKEKNIFIHDNIHTNEEVKSKVRMITIDDLQSDKYKSAVDGMANTYRAVEYFEKHFNKKFNSTVVSINVDTWKGENDKVVTDNAGGGYLDIEGEKVAFLMFPFASDKKNPQYSAYLDVVAHEYTHAITNSEVFGSGYSTDSRYFERNALKEAYSDIFGELIEQEYTGETDWKHNGSSIIGRNIKNPDNKKYSKRYTGTKDNGGAHWNSTIISHTAYLMSKSNDSNKYDTEFLLDYNQLRQLWYGSLEHLNNKSDFSDCRYAIEVSAEDLIEKGVLVKNNLKVIQQAFEEVGVSSNPIRRGAKDSAEIIKGKHTLVVLLEEETNSTEIVEIEEIDNLEITLDNIDSLFTLSYENEFNNLFLACQYNKPSEIDLDTILYHGLGNSNNKFTSEECSLLNTYFDSDIVEHIGLTKIKESELNNYLKNKTGLKINEFNNNLNYIYIDKYKAYYRYSKTDTIAIIDFHFTNVEKSDDNIYTAIYIRDNVENTKYEVKFKVNNGVLQFISNKEMNEDENWKKEIESNESVQTTVNHTNDELKNNLTGYWCSKDGKNIIYFDACDPLFDAYYVDFRNDRYYLEVPYRVEELEYDKIALLTCDDGYDSYTFTLKNDQLISNDLVLNKVPCNYKTQFHGEWNNDKYKYDFKDTGKYYTSDEDNKWGHYYVINDSQIILFKEDKHFEIKKYIINENKLILDDDITLKKQGEYKNSLDKLNSLSNIICGTWIEKDTLMEEYRFYSNGLYERYSVVYNGEQLISSNCLESECYEIIDGNTVRIYTSDGLLSTDLKYDESTKILKIGSEYMKKE